MTASRWDLLDEAHRALSTAVAGVRDDGWTLPTPCEQWTVAQVLRHASGDHSPTPPRSPAPTARTRTRSRPAANLRTSRRPTSSPR